MNRQVLTEFARLVKQKKRAEKLIGEIEDSLADQKLAICKLLPMRDPPFFYNLGGSVLCVYGYFVGRERDGVNAISDCEFIEIQIHELG